MKPYNPKHLRSTPNGGKRFLARLVVLCLILGLLPVSALAAADDALISDGKTSHATVNGDIEYGKIVVTGGKSQDVYYRIDLDTHKLTVGILGVNGSRGKLTIAGGTLAGTDPDKGIKAYAVNDGYLVLHDVHVTTPITISASAVDSYSLADRSRSIETFSLAAPFVMSASATEPAGYTLLEGGTYDRNVTITTPVEFPANVTVKGDLTLSSDVEIPAGVTVNVTGTLRLDGADGTVASIKGTVKATTVSVASTVTVDLGSDEGSATGILAAENVDPGAGNLVLSANGGQFLDATGNEIGEERGVEIVEDEFILPVVTGRIANSGQVFKGWAETDDATVEDKVASDGDTISVSALTLAAQKEYYILYAIWEEDTSGQDPDGVGGGSGTTDKSDKTDSSTGSVASRPTTTGGGSSGSGGYGGSNSSAMGGKKATTGTGATLVPAPSGGSTGGVGGFSDVPYGHSFATEIAWAQANGILGGYADGSFRPSANTTRQALWMVLARLSGTYPSNMAEARTWAVNSGISDGTNGEGNMSRQQFITMLYRYAQMQGYALTGAADLGSFSDNGVVASYAREAIAWGVANGVITGTTDGRLNPEGTATRAHFAAFVYRFSNLGLSAASGTEGDVG